MSEGGEGAVFVKSGVPLLPVSLTSSPGPLAALTRPDLTPGVALLKEVLFTFYT